MPNYELEATGEGMWRRGQEHLTAPYVERYFDELPGTVAGPQRLAARRRRRVVLPAHLADRADPWRARRR